MEDEMAQPYLLGGRQGRESHKESWLPPGAAKHSGGWIVLSNSQGWVVSNSVEHVDELTDSIGTLKIIIIIINVASTFFSELLCGKIIKPAL